MNPILRSIVEKLFGTLLRHGLTMLGAWMAAQGVGVLDAHTQANLLELGIGGICLVAGLAWSCIRSHLHAKEIDQMVSILQRYGVWPSKPPPTSTPPAALLLALLVPAFCAGCAVMSGFDQNTYAAATEIKGEAMALIAKAAEPASAHAAAISALKVRLSAQLAYEQGKGKANLISATQWAILVAPEGHLLGGLLKEWEDGKTFSPPYLVEKRQQIADGFDQILKLEGAKTQ